jgi:hypothetical protein
MTTTVPSSLDVINELFDVEDELAVRGYLGDHPFLVPLLIEAHQRIPGYFPKQSRVRLQLLPDRDDGDRAELFAIIQTDLPEDQALLLLDRFDEGWWLETAVQGRGRLTIDVEAVSQCSIDTARSTSSRDRHLPASTSPR